MADKRFVAKNGLDNNNQTITNVSDPQNAQDAATKAFASNASNLTSGTVNAARLPAAPDFGTVTADALQFDAANPAATTAVGQMTWNPDDGTLDLGLKGGNVTLQLGQQEFVRVVNPSGSTLTKGQAVYIAGAQGNRVRVALARSDSELTSLDTLGIVAESIASEAEGFVITAGLLRNIDTSAWAEGAVLWLSNTTAGALTTTRPVAPNHGVQLGFVVRAHASVGIVFVQVQNGYELDELHNVLIASPSTGDLLRYDGTKWINEAPTSANTGSKVVVRDASGNFAAGTITATLVGNASTATALATGRTISVTGDVTGTSSAFDGTANVSFATTLANSGVSAGTYNDSTTQVRPFTVDAKGRITAIGAAVTITPAFSSLTGTPTTLSGYGITDAQPLDADLTAIAALAGTSGFLKKTAANTWSLDTSTYLTGNQSITLSGDASGSGATAITVTLANSGVSAGTYGSSTAVPVVTVDAKGRVTSVTTSSISGSLTFTGDVTGTGSTGTSTALTLANSGVAAGTYTKVTVDAKGRVTTGASLASGDLPTYTGTITSSQVTTALGFTPENAANKGVANGYASLDSGGKVPSAQLPSYVDDVLEYANTAGFPGTGETGKIYVALDVNKVYRWSGSAYVEISPSPGSTDAVTEGSTNLYFTNTRARNAISVSGSLSYNAGTGVISYTQPTNVSTFSNDSGYITSSALSPYLTTSTAASTYLPLSGGTISAGSGYPLILNTTQRYVMWLRNTNSTGTGWWLANDGGSLIFHANGVGDLASLSSAGTFNAVNLTVGGNQVLHASNYGSYALPLSGGTLTGVVRGPGMALTGFGTGTAGGNLELGFDGTQAVVQGYNRTSAAYVPLWLETSSLRIGINGNSRVVVDNSGITAVGYLDGASLRLGGTSTINKGPTWTEYRDPDGSTKLWLGNNASFYANASNFYFRSNDSAATFMGLASTGLTVSGTAYSTFSKPSPNAYQTVALFGNTDGGVFITSNNAIITKGAYYNGSWVATSTFGSGIDLQAADAKLFYFSGATIGQTPTMSTSHNILHAGNYNSYSPTLTGTGASGTWGIGISGTAANATTFASQGEGQFVYGDSGRRRGVRLITNWNQQTYQDVSFLSSENGTTNAPTTDYTYGLQYSFHRDGAGYRTQLVTALYSNLGLYVRNSRDGDAWTSWKELLHSGNYNSFSPTLTGTGASGTWGIRVTGFANQGSARLYSTDASYNYDSGNPYFGYLTYDGSRWLFQVSPGTPAAVRVAYADSAGSADTIDGIGFVNTGSNSGVNADTIDSNGISYYTAGVTNFSGNSTDGALYSQRYNTSWQHQIAADYRSGQIALRGRNNGTWQSWRTVLDSGNYSSYALPLSGGTLSGLLNVGSNVDSAASSAYIAGYNGFGARVSNNAYWNFTGLNASGSRTFYVRGDGTGYFDGNLGLGATPDVRLSVNGDSHTSGYIYMGGSAGSVGGWGSRHLTSSGDHTINARSFTFNNVGYGSNWSVALANGNVRQGNDLARPLVSWSYGGNSSGMVIFSFPGNSGNYGMVHCVFDIYEYSGNHAATVVVGGHNWNGAWYNYGSNVIGQTDKAVRIGFKDGKYCVVFGTSGSSWSYGTIVLRKIHNGGFYTGNMDMSAAFTAAQTTTESFSWVSGDLRELRTPSNFVVGGSSYAYDAYTTGGWFRNHTNNNGIYWSQTGWHLYPASSSDFFVRSGANGGTLRFTESGGTTYGYLHWASDRAMGFLTDAGNWRLRVDNSRNLGYIQDISADGNLYLNNGSPTIYLQDNNHRSSMIHCNSNIFYILRGAGTNSTGWSTFNGYWPLEINLENNDATFGRHLNTVGDVTASGAVYSSNWFRSYGATGWYNQTYGAGIWMNDGSWVRVYGTVGFYATAQIAAVGDVTAYYSDERFKTKIGVIDNALDKVKQLSGFLYVENDLAKSLGYSNDKQQVGVSAQQVQAVLPEAVTLAPVDMHTDKETGEITSKSGENYLTVKYERLVPLLIEAIKEQQARIESLEARLNALS